MKKTLPKYPRVLGLAPSTRGFGYALIEGLDTLADWGVKSIAGDKNNGSIAKAQDLIIHYKPDVVVLEDFSNSRFPRIRALSKRIVAMAQKRGVRVFLFSPEQVRQAFFPDGQGTKHALAEMLANKFPEELSFRLPPKRRPWMSEDYTMDIFDAVALALMPRRKD